ncbi:hypothetical protein [Candidatus Tokpelaia sp.]|uniref:hypothetical protein n=1 Tax=Candidatus Tokpelaia sp. TaxID=2233777 RepID=UPI0012396412|nr:hypothetical protein [Candidatus Tokpelaia sp.]
MLNLLFPFFGKFAADNVKAFVKKTKMQAVCWAGIAAALFFAAFFACVMLFFYIQSVMSPIKAAAVLMLIWLLIAFIGVICLKISLDRQKRKQQAFLAPEQKRLLAGTAMAAAPALLAMGVRSYKKIGRLAVLATGAAAVYSLWRGKGAQSDK